jgi:hypothetical protein
MGHEVSPEARAKIGAATRGRVATGETRTRMSAAQLDRVGSHGHNRQGQRTPEYVAWDAMIQRCTNPNDTRYADYGGRGITVHSAWRESFLIFLGDVGVKPEPKSQYSIDRIDNDRGYEPGNVRWATRSEQQRNRPRFNPDKRGKPIADKLSIRQQAVLVRARLSHGAVWREEHLSICRGLANRGLVEELGHRQYRLTPAGLSAAAAIAAARGLL